MINDEYRALLEDARDALYDLLQATDPAKGMLVRRAYGDIDRTLTEDDERARRRERWAERDREWHNQLTVREREDLVLEQLATRGFTITDLTRELGTAHPELKIWRSGVTQIVRGLFNRRELSREPEPFAGKVRYRYFRDADLNGPIVDLERAYREAS